jgi:hypothetical protein
VMPPVCAIAADAAKSATAKPAARTQPAKRASPDALWGRSIYASMWSPLRARRRSVLRILSELRG